MSEQSGMISAILLAAGLSARMGNDNKLLLPFRGSTFIRHMVNVLADSRVQETVVVLGHEAERVREQLVGRAVLLVDNPDYAEGMGSSLRCGLRQVSAAATGVLVCLTDQPLLEPADINRLIDAFDPDSPQDIIVPQHLGQRGNPVLFSARYRDEVLGGRGPIAGCRGIVQSHPQAVKLVDMATDHVLRDIDTPEDYRILLSLSDSN